MGYLTIELALIGVSSALIVAVMLMHNHLAGKQIRFESEKFGKFSIEPVPFCLLLGVLLSASAGFFVWQDQKLKEKEAEEKKVGIEAVKQELDDELNTLKSYA